jgi:hypothetical protein
MRRIDDLRFLFRVVVVLEVLYAVAGMMPPDLVAPATGWLLNPYGHWITKLLAVALASQALTAWVLRDEPHLGVATALASYQVGSATVDWVMWLSMADEGLFAGAQARVGVLFAIPSHYLLGILLFRAVRIARGKGRVS